MAEPIPGRPGTGQPPAVPATPPPLPVPPPAVPPAPGLRQEWDVLLAVAVGGVAGAEGRYALARAWPSAAGQFPWATLVTNVSGCLLIGVLMVFVARVLRPGRSRLVRPLLGAGVLGGYTTFSSFAVQTVQLGHAHRLPLAAGYVLASLAACLAVVWAASRLTEAALSARPRPDDRPVPPNPAVPPAPGQAR